jgi:hypothetical protein
MNSFLRIHLFLICLAISSISAQNLSPRCAEEDAKLNSVYQQLRGSLSTQEKAELKTQQRKWLTLRTVGVANSEDKESAFYQLTADRVAYLEQSLQHSTPTSLETTSNETQRRLVGNWTWFHHRHSSNIKFQEDGTYVIINEDEKGDDKWEKSVSKGAWRLEGDKLFLIQEGTKSADPTKIIIEDNDHITLDDFQTYRRTQKSEVISGITTNESYPDALSECLSMTKVIMDQKITQSDPKIRKLCTKRFKALLQKGFHTIQDDPMGFFDCDVRYDTQDDYPKIIQMGPAISQGNSTTVPIKLQFGTNPPFTKTWVYLQEDGKWMADDLLTQKEGQTNSSSLADELLKYQPSGGSNSKK